MLPFYCLLVQIYARNGVHDKALEHSTLQKVTQKSIENMLRFSKIELILMIRQMWTRLTTAVFYQLLASLNIMQRALAFVMQLTCVTKKVTQGWLKCQ